MRVMTTVLFSLFTFAVGVTQARGAHVLLASGLVQSGTVIVRISAWSNKPVITLQSLATRLYQFSADQVVEVGAETEVIVCEPTDLHTSPSSESERVIRLERGNEVTIIADKGDWVRVKAWGGNEGWMEERHLCNRLVFSKEEE